MVAESIEDIGAKCKRGVEHYFVLYLVYHRESGPTPTVGYRVSSFTRLLASQVGYAHPPAMLKEKCERAEQVVETGRGRLLCSCDGRSHRLHTLAISVDRHQFTRNSQPLCRKWYGSVEVFCHVHTCQSSAASGLLTHVPPKMIAKTRIRAADCIAHDSPY